MNIKEAYGFGILVQGSVFYGFFTLAFLAFSVFWFGYGLWAVPGVFFPLAALFIFGLVSLWYGVLKAFKPFKDKDGEIIEAKVTNINLRGWMLAAGIFLCLLTITSFYKSGSISISNILKLNCRVFASVTNLRIAKIPRICPPEDFSFRIIVVGN